jgi:hypothetical protein
LDAAGADVCCGCYVAAGGAGLGGLDGELVALLAGSIECPFELGAFVACGLELCE